METSSTNSLATRTSWPLIIGFSLLAVGLAVRFVAVFSEAVNWDEFALVARADRTLRLGDLTFGGRPGLVTLLLLPFVKDCIDTIATVVNARVLWQAITWLYLAGVYALVVRWHRYSVRNEDGHLEALFAVLLLAFTPAFAAWSIQIRTDQAALATAVWGGVLLLSDRRRAHVMAGLIFGISLLFTQKGLYAVAACVALLIGGELCRIAAKVRSARTASVSVAKVLLPTSLACIATVTTYFLLVPDAAHVATAKAVGSSWQQMNWFRQGLGYRVYLSQAPLLLVHWLLLVGLIAISVISLARNDRYWLPAALTSWLLLLLGTAVIVVHGSSFAYFMMTAGLFPALALSLVVRRVASASPRMSSPFLGGLAVLLFSAALPQTLQLLDGTQASQRQTMQFIHASGLSRLRGYQVEGALACEADPDPMPVMFSQQIARRFRDSPQAIASFIAEFKNRPIAYMVESYRMSQFPEEIRSFWKEHYLPHSGSLYVAGFTIDRSQTPSKIEVLVPGEYRWSALSQGGRPVLRVANATVEAGASVHLTAGLHTVQTVPAGSIGTLVLAVPRWPQTDYVPFYDHRQVRRLGGLQ